jgi:hypothetical protein
MKTSIRSIVPQVAISQPQLLQGSPCLQHLELVVLKVGLQSTVNQVANLSCLRVVHAYSIILSLWY